ncbi:unnamed protein product [Cyclocybe aegerita]|uniref:Uncharacterized protein n=1 Tax=Cyclocybe aegerita TaxID=1973307 RepID=A0A8S0W833_CYCAE|nr:unnamed protein product [Cyclocybe aegerita]
MPDSAAVLNIILPTMYGLSCSRNSPSLDNPEAAVDRMPSYGLVPSVVIVLGNPLLAGHHDLHALAERVSSHLLSYYLPDIMDDMTTRMGAKYLCQLMKLHLSCQDALKSIIIRPPHPHPPTQECDFCNRRN